MNLIYEKSPFCFEANAGVSIYLAVQTVLSYRTTQNKILVFNEIVLYIYPNSCEEDILEKYSLLCSLRNESTK